MERTFDLSPRALFTAAREGDVARIQLCAKQGVNLNIHDASANEETPLHMAAARNHKGAVQALLEGGAQVDSRNVRETCLLPAVFLAVGAFYAFST